MGVGESILGVWITQPFSFVASSPNGAGNLAFVTCCSTPRYPRMAAI